MAKLCWPGNRIHLDAAKRAIALRTVQRGKPFKPTLRSRFTDGPLTDGLRLSNATRPLRTKVVEVAGVRYLAYYWAVKAGANVRCVCDPVTFQEVEVDAATRAAVAEAVRR